MHAADAVYAADAHADDDSDAVTTDDSRPAAKARQPSRFRGNAITSTSKSYFWHGNHVWWRGTSHASEWPPKSKLEAVCTSKFCCFICFVGRVVAHRALALFWQHNMFLTFTSYYASISQYHICWQRSTRHPPRPTSTIPFYVRYRIPSKIRRVGREASSSRMTMAMM